MTTTKAMEADRYARLAAQLVPEGWICTGSAVARTYRRGAAGGRKTRSGPYYSWTRKQKGRTVTTALSRTQYDLLRAAIRRQRKLAAILAAMHALSIRSILAATPGVERRNRRRAHP